MLHNEGKDEKKRDEPQTREEFEKMIAEAVRSLSAGERQRVTEGCRSHSKETLEEMIEKYSALAKQGDAWAQRKLGYIYMELGQFLHNANSYAFPWQKLFLRESIFWFQEAAKLGDQTSQFELGRLYQFEDKNISGAIKWYRKAAMQGHVYAQSQLANIYAQNPKDYKEALVWNYQAVKQGYGSAGCNVSDILKEHDASLKKEAHHVKKIIHERTSLPTSLVDETLAYALPILTSSMLERFKDYIKLIKKRIITANESVASEFDSEIVEMINKIESELAINPDYFKYQIEALRNHIQAKIKEGDMKTRDTRFDPDYYREFTGAYNQAERLFPLPSIKESTVKSSQNKPR